MKHLDGILLYGDAKSQAITLRPDFPEAYNIRGIAPVAIGNYDQTIWDHKNPYLLVCHRCFQLVWKHCIFLQ